MGWAVGWDPNWKRDIGYGVPAICDHPDCGAEIHRGLAYICGGEPWGGDEGCGLFFCQTHTCFGEEHQICQRCLAKQEPFMPTPDTAEWVAHKLTDSSWQNWRDENPAEVERLRALIAQAELPPARGGGPADAATPSGRGGDGCEGSLQP